MLRPLLLSRLVPLMLLIALGYLAVMAGQREEWAIAGALAAALFPVAYFAVRAVLARVVCDADSVTVHGFLRTREIPRTAVTALKGGPWPRLQWQVAGGKRRSTLVSPFAAASISAPWVAEHNSRCLHLLARCIGDRALAERLSG